MSLPVKLSLWGGLWTQGGLWSWLLASNWSTCFRIFKWQWPESKEVFLISHLVLNSGCGFWSSLFQSLLHQLFSRIVVMCFNLCKYNMWNFYLFNTFEPPLFQRTEAATKYNEIKFSLNMCSFSWFKHVSKTIYQ